MHTLWISIEWIWLKGLPKVRRVYLRERREIKSDIKNKIETVKQISRRRLEINRTDWKYKGWWRDAKVVL
jgi:hypothetical protein